MNASNQGSFRPNLAEIRFVLSVWSLSEAMTERGHSTDVVDDILEQAGRFASDVLYPLSALGDSEGSRLEDGKVLLPSGFASAYRLYSSAGWHGLGVATALGGQGLPTLLSMGVTELFNTANLALTMGIMPAGAAVTLFDRYGTAEQKATYIPQIVSGAWMVTMALTEPQAGTDLGAIKTRVSEDGNQKRVLGEKSLITFGDHEISENIIHLVLARSPNGPPGTKGLSLYVVPKFLPNIGTRNDISCIAIEKKIGLRGSPTATLVFGANGRGAIAELLGTENKGLEQMFILMNRARLNVAIFGLSSAEAARQAAARYAVERIQGRDKAQRPVSILYHPDVRRMMASMTARTEAARYIAYYTAALIDEADLGRPESASAAKRLEIMTPIAKTWCTETGFDVASMGLQVHGGLGYLDGSEAAQYFREARVHTIYEGTTGVHASDLIFRKIIRDRGAAVSEFFTEMRQAGQTAGASENHLLSLAGTALLEAVAQCEAVTRWILSQDESSAEGLQANGAHFLMMMGACVGGWASIRAALFAESDRSLLGDQFADRKIRQACFFMQQIAPPAIAMSDTIMSRADTILDIVKDFDGGSDAGRSH